MNKLRLTVAAAALVLASACSNPQGDWQKAEAENTEAAYQSFLEKYPEGEWAQKAQAQLDSMKDTRDWENAQTADALDGYNNYLSGHPNGAHMGEARQRITELERDAAWTAAQQAGSKQALEDFLTRYPDAPQADQARSQIAALNPPPAPAKPPKAAGKDKGAKPGQPAAAAPKKAGPAASGGGDYQVQLGAFSTMEKAKAELNKAEKRYHGIVGSLSIQKPTGAEQVYRLRSVAMAESAARSVCQKMKGSGQDCVVVRR